MRDAHQRDHREGGEGESPVEDEQQDRGADQRQRALDERRDAVGDELVDRLDVVRQPADDHSGAVPLVEAERQALEVIEEVVRRSASMRSPTQPVRYVCTYVMPSSRARRRGRSRRSGRACPPASPLIASSSANLARTAARARSPSPGGATRTGTRAPPVRSDEPPERPEPPARLLHDQSRTRSRAPASDGCRPGGPSCARPFRPGRSRPSPAHTPTQWVGSRPAALGVDVTGTRRTGLRRICADLVWPRP